MSGPALELHLPSAILDDLEAALLALRPHGAVTREQLAAILLERGLHDVQELPGDLPLDEELLRAVVEDVRREAQEFQDVLANLFARGLSIVQVCVVLERLARARARRRTPNGQT